MGGLFVEPVEFGRDLDRRVRGQGSGNEGGIAAGPRRLLDEPSRSRGSRVSHGDRRVRGFDSGAGYQKFIHTSLTALNFGSSCECPTTFDGALGHQNIIPKVLITQPGTGPVTEGRTDEALEEFRLAREVIAPDTPLRGLALLAQAYELAGQLDSAVAMYEEYLTTPSSGRGDSWNVARR